MNQLKVISRNNLVAPSPPGGVVSPAAGAVSPAAGIPVGYGPGGPLPLPTPWINYGTYLLWEGGLVIGSPTGEDFGPGTVNATGYFINGQPFDFGNALPITGGTITGSLTIQGPTTINNSLTVAGPVDGIKLDMGTF